MNLASTDHTPMPCWGSADLEAPPSDGSEHGADLWTVLVWPTPSGRIVRTVAVQRRRPVRDSTCNRPASASQHDEVIWPAWCPHVEADVHTDASTVTALERIHGYWDKSADQVRGSAKWMATAVGLALATLIGASPFADLAARSPGVWFWVPVAVGLVCLGSTLLLLTQVLLPSATSYDSVQIADRRRCDATRSPRRWPARNSPLETWKHQVESQPDLWLPSGVTCLDTLREAMIVDELTLVALSQAEGVATTLPEEVGHVRQAQRIQAARLRAWRTAAARIVLIGELYRVRARAWRAICLGIPLCLFGALSIIVAFAQLAPTVGR